MSKQNDIVSLAEDNDLEKLILTASYKTRKEHKNDLRFVLLESIKSKSSASEKHGKFSFVESA